MAIETGILSTDILLTPVGKKWFLMFYPKDSVLGYDEDKAFDLISLGEDFVEVTSPLGIHYRFPIHVNGLITFQMAAMEWVPPMKGSK